MTDVKQAQACAQLLQAIAESNRIRIIDCLRTGPKNVTELANLLKVEIVNVSHHLGVLRLGGLVLAEKKGRFVIYSLHDKYFRQRQREGDAAQPRLVQDRDSAQLSAPRQQPLTPAAAPRAFSRAYVRTGIRLLSASTTGES